MCSLKRQREGDEQVTSFRKANSEQFQKNFAPAIVLIGVALAAVPKPAFAQTDEIQVYDAEIEETGKFNIMVQFILTT
jgi:hypothetical protein